MYIYFDNQGKQKAVIPHGEVPREGADLNIYVCLPYDFWTSKGKTDGNFSKTLELIYPDKTISVAMYPESNLGEEKKFEGEDFTFFKMYACEPTYDFMEGGLYLRYQWKLSGDEVKAGKITAIIKFESNSETIINGSVQIFVEKTYSESKRLIAEEVAIKYDDIIGEINKVNTSKVDKTAKIAGIEIQDGITADELNVALSGGFEQSFRKEIEFSGETQSRGDMGTVAIFDVTLPENVVKGANYALKFTYATDITDSDLDCEVYIDTTIPDIVGREFTLKSGLNEKCTLRNLLDGFSPVSDKTWLMNATYNGESFVLDELGVSQSYQLLTGEELYNLYSSKKLPYNSYVFCTKDYNPTNPSETWSPSASNKSQWLRKDRLYQIKPSGLSNLGIVAKSASDPNNLRSSQIFAMDDNGNLTTFSHTSNPTISPRGGISVPIRLDDNLWAKDYPDNTDFSKITDNEHLIMPKKYIDGKVPLKPKDDVTMEVAEGKKFSVDGDFEVTGNFNVKGKTTTIDAENVTLKDKLLQLAKGNETALQTAAGFFITKCDGTNNYGIVFKADGKPYYGKIVLDDDGNVSSQSELKLLAFQEFDETDFDQAYIKKADGSKDLFDISKNADEDTIAMRGTDGTLNVGNAFDPRVPDDYYEQSYTGRKDENDKSLYKNENVKGKAVSFDTLEAWFQDKYARKYEIDNAPYIHDADEFAVDYGKATFITPEYVNIAVKKALSGEHGLGTENPSGYLQMYSGLNEIEKATARERLGAANANDVLSAQDVIDIISGEDYVHKNLANTFYEQQVFNKGAVFNGDIIQDGKAYTTHSEKLYSKKDFIVLREGATTPLGNKETGLVALNYANESGTFKNGGIVYDGNGFARVGDISFKYTALTEKPTYDNAEGYFYLSNGNYIEIKESEVSSTQYNNITTVYEQSLDASTAQAIATREDDSGLTDKNLMAWDGTEKKLIDSGFSKNYLGTLVQNFKQYYKHHITLTLPNNYFVYYTIDSSDKYEYTLSTLPVTYQELTDSFILFRSADGYFNMSGMVYRDSTSTAKILLHGVYGAGGTNLSYFTFPGTTISAVSDEIETINLVSYKEEPYYELIEKIIIGYSLLSAEPEDFAENYANYYKTNGKARNDKDFAYVALTEAEPFEAGKYYYKDTAGSKFSRQTEPDGTPYKFSKMTLLFQTEDDKKLNAWTSIIFDMKDENFQDLQSMQPGIYPQGMLYVGGPDGGWRIAFGTFVTDGNSAVTFGGGLTEERYSYRGNNTITNTQVFDKKPICWRLRAGAGIFPVGTTIYIYGVRK